MEGIPFTSPGQFTAESKWRLTEEDGGTRLQVWIRVEWHKKPPFGMQGITRINESITKPTVHSCGCQAILSHMVRGVWCVAIAGKIDSGTVDGFTKFFSEYGKLAGRKLAAAGGKVDGESGEAGKAIEGDSSSGPGASSPGASPLQNPIFLAVVAAAAFFFLLFIYSWWSSSSWKAVALTLQERNSVLHEQVALLKDEILVLSRTRSGRGAPSAAWQNSLAQAIQLLQSLSTELAHHKASSHKTSSSSSSASAQHKRPSTTPSPAATAAAASTESDDDYEAPHHTEATKTSTTSTASTPPVRKEKSLLGSVVNELEREVQRLQQEMDQL
jgi:hypothetical protein